MPQNTGNHYIAATILYAGAGWFTERAAQTLINNWTLWALLLLTVAVGSGVTELTHKTSELVTRNPESVMFALGWFAAWTTARTSGTFVFLWAAAWITAYLINIPRRPEPIRRRNHSSPTDANPHRSR